MDSFVFNSFKENLMNGKVSSTDNWYFWPVNSKFTNDYENIIKYFKTSADFSAFAPDTSFSGNKGDNWLQSTNYWSAYQTIIYPTKYEYRPMQDTDVAAEPEFVDINSIDFFINNRYPNEKHLKELFFNSASDFFRSIGKEEKINPEEASEIGRGFYYVRTSEELKWCANKVNGAAFDNTINIVLGDNIGTDIDSNDDTINYDLLNPTARIKIIDYSIGSNPAQPYEGIFYGNGYRIKNIRLDCGNDTNGIIGYLGTSGWIDSVDIVGKNILHCNKTINIEHLTTKGTDVVAGILCGKNNGKITNVRLSGDIFINNFVPKMYSVNSKGVETDDNATTAVNDSLQFYPDYLCYNNPGNIVPYIGYFNEGVFATYSGYNKNDKLIHQYWNTKISDNGCELKKLDKPLSPLEWYYWYGLESPFGGYLMQFTSPQNRKNVLWYDANIFSKTNSLISDQLSPCITSLGLVLWDGDFNNSDAFSGIENSQYFDKSVKLTQQNRQAYYVAPIIGVNNSKIDNISVKSDIYLSGTFVGFIGGIIGKQNKGEISNVLSNINVDELLTVNAIKDTPLYNDVDIKDFSYYLRDYIDNDHYWFAKKSIKNIGGVFGSLIVGNINNTILENVSANFVNKNNIIYKDNTIEYDDYYFLNKYAGLTPVVEFNSCNISDMWETNEPNSIAANDINNPNTKSIAITNSVFQYSEIKHEPILNYISAIKPHAASNKAEGKSFMLGTSSPIIAEIKPTYLSIPSLIETPFLNCGEKPENKADPSMIFDMDDLLGLNPAGYMITKQIDNQQYNRVGLFTVDQNFASPTTDPGFWSINVEVDLPGISNTVTDLDKNLEEKGIRWPSVHDYKGKGYAGFVLDRMNHTAANNFDLDVRNMPSKLINWNNVKAIDGERRSLRNPIETVTVPMGANITPAVCDVYTGTSPNYDIFSGTAICQDYINDINNKPGYENSKAIAKLNDFNGNKYLTTYPYFGSDLKIIPNTITSAELSTDDSDTINPNMYQSFTLTALNPIYINGQEKSIGSHDLCNCVSSIKMTINTSAFSYQPFTQELIPPGEVSALYDITVDVDGHSLQHSHSPLTPQINPDTNDILWDLSVKFRNYDDYKSKVFGNASSGFIFLVDSTDGGNNYLWYIIPFDVKPLSYENKNPDGSYYKQSPPYGFFHGSYVATLHAANPTYTDNGLYLTEDWVGIWNYNLYNDETLLYPVTNIQRGFAVFKCYPPTYHLPFELEKDSMKFNDYYFIGYTNSTDKTPNWTKNNEPPITTAALTGYKWAIYDDVKMFQLASDPTQGTLDTSLAVTGYVSDDAEEVANDMWIYANATKPNGDVVELLFPLYSHFTDDRNDAHKMSAVELSNISRENWNWQNKLVDETTYNYYNVGNASTLILEYQGAVYTNASYEYKLPKRWDEYDLTGKFVNDIANAYSVPVDGLTPESISYVKWNDLENSRFTEKAANGSDDLDANIQQAIDDKGKEYNFYMYTYKKEQTYTDISKPGIKVPVTFNYKNGKGGYWFHNKDNEEFKEPTDGNIMYYPNVFNIGKTFNQRTIINYLGENESLLLSGFSADDFEGIYVTNSKREPIMYIDVGLGECPEGTSWSLSSYPSTKIVDRYKNLNTRTNLSGLILEIN